MNTLIRAIEQFLDTAKPNQSAFFDFKSIQDSDLDEALTIAAAQVREDMAAQRTLINPLWDNWATDAQERNQTIHSMALSYASYMWMLKGGDFYTPLYEKHAQVASELSLSFLSDPVFYAQAKYILENDPKVINIESPENRVIQKILKDMEKNGVLLDNNSKKRLLAIDNELQELAQKFNNNVLAVREGSSQIFSKDELDGVNPDMLQVFLNNAKEEGKKGYLVKVNESEAGEVLDNCHIQTTRHQMWLQYFKPVEGDLDNRPVLKKMLALRDERSKMMGFSHHADFVLSNKMMENTQNAMALCEKSLALAKISAGAEWQKISDNTDLPHLADLSYFLEQYRKKQSPHIKDPREYLYAIPVIERTVQWFAEIHECTATRELKPAWHPDVMSWVFKEKDGRESVLIIDPFTRRGKMDITCQNNLTLATEQTPGTSTSVILMNFTKNEQAKLRLQEVSDLFHEMGHAMHSMLSRPSYDYLANYEVEWDFIELPSQIMENFVQRYEVFAYLSKGLNPDGELSEKDFTQYIEHQKFGTGLGYIHQIEKSLFDLKLHSGEIKDDPSDAAIKHKKTQLGLKIDDNIAPLSQNDHLFGDEGYAACFYSYLWSDVLAKAGYAAIKQAETEGQSLPDAIRPFRERVLVPGASQDAKNLYQAMTGSEPNLNDFFKETFPLAVITTNKTPSP